MFQRCLICTDFSDGIHRLVHFVPSLVAGGIRQIVFMHSVPFWQDAGIPRIDTEKVEKARDRLADALKSVPDGVDVKLEVPSGRPIDTILETAKTYQSEVIILGMASRSLLTETLFGSTSMELAQRTPVPLLVLRPQLISAYTTEELDLRCRHLFRYFLIPYNNSGASKSLVQQIKKSAQHQPSKILEQCLLCWVVGEGGRRDLQDYHKQQIQQAQEVLAPVKADLESVGLQVAIEVRQGNPILEILEVALMFDISAIAACSEHIGNLLQFPTPSFTAELMRRSWHPVLFFPLQK